MKILLKWLKELIAKTVIEIAYLNKERTDDLKIFKELYDNTLHGAITNLKIAYKEFKAVFLITIADKLEKIIAGKDKN